MTPTYHAEYALSSGGWDGSPQGPRLAKLQSALPLCSELAVLPPLVCLTELHKFLNIQTKLLHYKFFQLPSLIK
jgi:hypothetical protein